MQRILVVNEQDIVDNKSEDINLIQRALKGDQKGFQSLYQKYKHNFFVICLRYAKDRDTAQDYLQETLINIFKNLDHFDATKGNFEAWAKRVKKQPFFNKT